ncbi:MAG: hypothetical protein J0H09_12265 [Burkholderiales bacterium]|nr:hypothetical protein [Burkholderiales bacterium]
MPVALRTLIWSSLFLLAALGWWCLQGWPREVPEAGVERVACVSYAPFRLPGESPFDATFRVARERIVDDLRLLAPRTRCVRTYSIDQGLDQVPGAARELGMQVLLGVWIGRDRDKNRVELERALSLANAHADVVRGLIIGNEVMLRRELPERELLALLQQAQAATAVPVTYADVWEFWLRHPQLAAAVDFLTIHILPYWEDEPVGVAAAVEHVRDVYRTMQQHFAGRTILIGETGWPRAGRARQQAQPGRVEQARFVRSFVAAAQTEGLPYNLIEAFDQPWKRRLEGAMGGYWGLLDSAGEAAFPWHGPVTADEHWRGGLAAGGAGLLLAGTIAWARRQRGIAWLAQTLAGAAIGAVLFAQWRYALSWHRDALELAIGAGGAMLGAVFGWLAVARGSSARALRIAGPLPGIYRLLSLRADAADAAHTSTAPHDAALSLLRALFLLGAAATMLLLVFDARYRGFPWPLFALPAGALLLLAAAGERLPNDAREERLLAWIVVLAAPLVIAFERPTNTEALAFVGLLLVLVVAGFGFPHRSMYRAPERTSTIAPSSAPSTDGSNE